MGKLDIEVAIREGRRSFEPGLLASAHRGILYIDEVNLLNDHVVDVLLDSAAMGRNFVEREGISFAHPAQFLLIGTMNPEEGDLRPQFIDRFGLAVEIDHIQDPERRADVIRRRIAYERDPSAFQQEWEQEESAERQRIADAMGLLPNGRSRRWARDVHRPTLRQSRGRRSARGHRDIQGGPDAGRIRGQESSHSRGRGEGGRDGPVAQDASSAVR